MKKNEIEIKDNYYYEETIKISLLLGSLITAWLFFIVPSHLHIYLLNIIVGIFGIRISAISDNKYINLIFLVLILLFFLTNVYLLISAM
jgi:hypothetical protein